MRTKTLWLWLALLVSSLALVAAGCGGDDDEGSSGTGATTEKAATEAANQVITVNWGTEPPSLDPGSRDRHDLVQHPAQHHGSARQARRRSQAGPGRGRELRDERGREDRHVRAPGRPEVDERRPGHRRGLRVLVEAHGLARARRRLRVPVLRHRRRAGVQQLRSQEGQVRRARRQDGRQGGRRQDARGQADDAAAVVHAAGRRTTRSWPSTRRPSSSSATSGPRPANIVTNGPFKLDELGAQRRRSTSSRTPTGATPTASS